MLVYDPHHVHFDRYSYPLKKFDSVRDPHGVYRVLDYPRDDGTVKPRCYYESFFVEYSGGCIREYPRMFLVIKLEIMAAEWLRRHLVHMKLKDGEDEDESDVDEDDNNEDTSEEEDEDEDEDGEIAVEVGKDTTLSNKRRESSCHRFCPVVTGRGRHAKTKEETRWEQTAATAYREYRDLLDRLHDLEMSFIPITGYSNANKISFGPNEVPRSLFDLPSIPGPTSPPVIRNEPAVNSIFSKDPRYKLRDDSPHIISLRESVKTRSEGRSWLENITHFLPFWSPIGANDDSRLLERRKDR